MEAIGIQMLAFLVAFSAIVNQCFGAQTQRASNIQLTEASPTPFPVCIDDSDCVKIGEGDKFACFQYLCYPWKNDTMIDAKNRRKTCRKDGECDAGQECFRHHDKRMVNRGLCFDEVKSCQTSGECSQGYQCCGGSPNSEGTCCEEKYYYEFTKLPCISHLGCQDLGLGDFCCPAKQPGGQNECCDTDPNPPPPTPRSIEAAGSVGQLTPIHISQLLLVAVSFMLFK